MMDQLQAIPAFLSFIVALVIATFGPTCGDSFKNWWRKPKLVPRKEVASNIQTYDRNGKVESHNYKRLIIENKGRGSARDVEVYVNKIIDGEIERVNFLPVPLQWTHAQTKDKQLVTRDIHSNQSAYLDLCALTNYEGEKTALCVAAGADIPAFSEIKKNVKTCLTLVIFQQSGHTKSFDIEIFWNGTDNFEVRLI